MTVPVRYLSVQSASLVNASTTVLYEVNIGAAQPGDHIYITTFAYAPDDNTNTPMGDWETPNGAGWSIVGREDITEGSVVCGGVVVFAKEAIPDDPDLDIDVLNPLDCDDGISFSQMVIVRGASGPPGAIIGVTAPQIDSHVPTPALDFPTVDSYAHLTVISAAHSATPIASPGIPYAQYQHFSTPTGEGIRATMFDTLGTPVDADIPSVILDLEEFVVIGPFQVWNLAVAFGASPAPSVVLLSPSESPRRQLGCADDYKVFITGADYETVIDEVGWSDIEWTRIEDEPSTAVFSAPDKLGGVHCVAQLGGLVPWRYGLRIERNDQSVWKGVVTGLQRQPGAVRVTASDIMVRFEKRLATRDTDITFDSADAGTAFATIILTAQIDGEAWSLQPPEALTLQPFSRTVVVRDFELAASLLNDLADAAIDYFVMDGVLHVYQVGAGWMYFDGANKLLEGPYNASRQLVYGTFTERSFVSLPLWSINGMSQANVGWLPGPDIGEEGARAFWTSALRPSVLEDGVLDIVESGDLFRPEEADVPEAVFQRHVDSLVALRGIAPAIIEDTPLTSSAPIDIDNLRPGSLWNLDIYDSGYGQLLQVARLKKVTVNVAKDQNGQVVETVKPTLFPPGYQES